jgi:hypothetical protein
LRSSYTVPKVGRELFASGGSIHATIAYDRLPDYSSDHRVKDTPKPRQLKTIEQARDYVSDAMALGRPSPWREVWHRLKTVTSEEEAIEAIGDLRELLEEEDLLLPDSQKR